MRTSTVLLIAFTLVMSWVESAAAQDQDEVKITRSDLATAYLRLEQALKNVTLDEAETARVNRAFDQSTLKFFAQQHGAAIKGLNEITASLDPSLGDDGLAAASLRASIRPPVWVKGTSVVPELYIETLYSAPLGDQVSELKVRLVILSPDGKVVHRFSQLRANLGPDKTIEFSVSMEQIVKVFKSTRYTLGFELESGSVLESTQWTVVPKPLDVVHAANKSRFNNIGMGDFQTEQAIATVMARNDLLTDKPSPETSAEFLIDPNELVKEVKKEVDMMAKKRNQKNPYLGREGDYWRVLKVRGKKDIPLRVYLPESVDKKESYPLVIAFHGAGGDENMFMDAYGAGKIKDLADEHGFLLVSPLTYSFSGAAMGPNFDLLMEVITHNYNVDLNRVYALGHSMGGMATSNLINLRGHMLAAAVPICGFGAIDADSDTLPAILVYAASLDPIVPASRIEPAVEKSRAAGAEIDYRLMENWGHTLTVGKVLPEAIAWMLEHTRE